MTCNIPITVALACTIAALIGVALGIAASEGDKLIAKWTKAKTS